MLVKSDSGSVQFCDLVEHPGGHDGGEYPQYEELGVAQDGSVYYKTGSPTCPNDTFCDQPNEDYIHVSNRRQGIGRLEAELTRARGHVRSIEMILAAFEADPFGSMMTYFDDEVYVPSEASEEDE